MSRYHSLSGDPVTDAEARYPDGWYFARFGEHLKPGHVVPVQFMSRRYALFRARSGQVGMVEAHCCHMGADLGRCGTVRGEHLVCGYHAWEFDTEGRCKLIPEVEKIPPRAGQRSVPVIERAGNIWFWHGETAPYEFTPVAYADSHQYLNLHGEVHIAQSGPLPVIEHITDISHFPYKHKATGPLEYLVLENEGRRFEFQLRPRGSAAKNIQFFKPYALITMAGPCSCIYRTQSGPDHNRTNPFLTMILGVTPVRSDTTIFSWRIAVRKIGPDLPMWPINKVVSWIMYIIVRRNSYADLEVLKWMRPPAKTLWVKPDGASVRDFREFYFRNIAPDRQPVADQYPVCSDLERLRTERKGSARPLTRHPRRRP